MWGLQLIVHLRVNASVQTLMRHFNSLYFNALIIASNLASVASGEKDLLDQGTKRYWLLKII